MTYWLLLIVFRWCPDRSSEGENLEIGVFRKMFAALLSVFFLLFTTIFFHIFKNRNEIAFNSLIARDIFSHRLKRSEIQYRLLLCSTWQTSKNCVTRCQTGSVWLSLTQTHAMHPTFKSVLDCMSCTQSAKLGGSLIRKWFHSCLHPTLLTHILH